ncbi:MAG: glycosyltransferase family 2 protein [Candidatus Brocadiia bacterium]|jgi:GT2 family glycosyltransferase
MSARHEDGSVAPFPPISVIVPTLDGLPLLQQCLPPLLKDLAQNSPGSEILIADDGSADGSAAYAAGLGERVRFCRNPAARGFAANCNQAARQARHELLFLLNNDVLVTPGLMPRLARHFTVPDVFAVSPSALITKNGVSFNEMPTRGFWQNGLILASQYRQPPTPPPDGVQDTFHVSGGFSMIRRTMFETLGGFDEIFSPFYWEDVDLSLRARRRGWRVLHDAGAVVHHRHQATIMTRHSRDYVERVGWRNIFLLNWKHLPPAVVVDRQLPRLTDIFLHGRWSYEGFLDALEFYPHAIRRRKILEEHDKTPLTEIIDFGRNEEGWRVLP